MKRSLFFFFTFAVLCSLASPIDAQYKGKYEGWSTGYYAYTYSYFQPREFRAFTHLINFSVTVGTKADTTGPWMRADTFVNGCHRNGIKAIAGVGGVGCGSYFLAACSDAAKRDTFVNSVIYLLKRYNYDGVDICWQDGIIDTSAAFIAAYSSLFKDLRDSFNVRNPRPLLSAATVFRMKNCMVSISEYVDQINLCSYYNYVTAMDSLIAPVLKAGVPKKILGIGFGFGTDQEVTDPSDQLAKCRYAIDSGWGGISAWDVSNALWNVLDSIERYVAPHTFPAYPILVSPNYGAFGVPLTIPLSWMPVTGALNFDVELATDTGFSNLVVRDSLFTATSKDVGPLVKGPTYYWRVFARNVFAEGPSSGTRWFSCDSPPVPPTLAAPSNLAVKMPFTIPCMWNTAANTWTYRIQLSNSNAFGTILFDDSLLPGTNRIVGPLYEKTTYFWRVNARNGAGNSAWSDPWSFTTDSVPLLLSPLNSAGNQPVYETLKWNQIKDLHRYQVQVATDSLFSSLVANDSSVWACAKDVGPLSYNTTYYWRVRIVYYSFSGWSATARFTTGAFSAPGCSEALYLNDPLTLTSTPMASGTSHVYSTPECKFKGVIGSAQCKASSEVGGQFDFCGKYQSCATLPGSYLHLAIRLLRTDTLFIVKDSVPADSLFHTVIFKGVISRIVNPGDSISLSLSALENDPKGVCVNTNFRISASSLLFFPATPPKLLQTQPPDKAADQPLSVAFSWSAISCPLTTYRFQASKSPVFSDTVVDDSTLTSAAKTVNSFLPNTSYYWRINAKDSAGNGPWSDAWSFTTGLPTGVLPRDFSCAVKNLSGNSSVLSYAIPVATRVTIRIYELHGRLIKALNKSSEQPGYYHVPLWTSKTATGYYILDFSAGPYAVKKKIGHLKQP